MSDKKSIKQLRKANTMEESVEDADAEESQAKEESVEQDIAWNQICANISIFNPVIAAFLGVFHNLYNNIEMERNTAAHDFNVIAVDFLRSSVVDDDDQVFIDDFVEEYKQYTCQRLSDKLLNGKISISYRHITAGTTEPFLRYVKTRTSTLLVLEYDDNENPPSSTLNRSESSYYELIATIQGKKSKSISIKTNLARDRISSQLAWGTFCCKTKSDDVVPHTYFSVDYPKEPPACIFIYKLVTLDASDQKFLEVAVQAILMEENICADWYHKLTDSCQHTNLSVHQILHNEPSLSPLGFFIGSNYIDKLCVLPEMQADLVRKDKKTVLYGSGTGPIYHALAQRNSNRYQQQSVFWVGGYSELVRIWAARSGPGKLVAMNSLRTRFHRYLKNIINPKKNGYRLPSKQIPCVMVVTNKNRDNNSSTSDSEQSRSGADDSDDSRGESSGSETNISDSSDSGLNSGGSKKNGSRDSKVATSDSSDLSGSGKQNSTTDIKTKSGSGKQSSSREDSPDADGGASGGKGRKTKTAPISPGKPTGKSSHPVLYIAQGQASHLFKLGTAESLRAIQGRLQTTLGSLAFIQYSPISENLLSTKSPHTNKNFTPINIEKVFFILSEIIAHAYLLPISANSGYCWPRLTVRSCNKVIYNYFVIPLVFLC
jgi:hypothetical protein